MVSITPASAAAIVSAEQAIDIEAKLEAKTKASLDCGGTPLKYDDGDEKYYFRLPDPCDLKITYAAETDVTITGNKIVAVADSIDVQSPGDVKTAYTAPLKRTGLKKLGSSEWWPAGGFQTGQHYEVHVVYRLIEFIPRVAADGAPAPGFEQKEIDKISVTPLRFIPIKKWYTLQLTGKVFTAWQPRQDGDASFIVPGIAGGVAVRLAKDFNDQDVLGLRAVLAAGPNLVTRQELTKDDSGESTQLVTKQRMQVLIGAELVLGRFLSMGVAHGILSGAKADGYLLLLTYGELYPAASTR